MPVTDVASLASTAIASQTALLRQKLTIATIGQAHKADEAVANLVANAAATGRGQVVDLKA